jgi:hypothetical protein
MNSQKPNIMPTELLKLHTKTQNNSNHVMKSYIIIEYRGKEGKRSHLRSHQVRLL